MEGENQKNYYELNKEKIKQKNKQYYQKNKSTILQKIKCMNCDGSYCLASLSTHLKTKKHLNAVQKTLENEIIKFEKEEDNTIDNLLSGNI